MTPLTLEKVPTPSDSMPTGLIREASLRGIHTLGLDCTAWGMVDAVDKEHLIQLRKWARKNERRVVILGGGSNVFFGHRYIDALIIRIGDSFRQVKINHDRQSVRVGAATHWRTMIKKCRDEGFGGLEYGWCIPGTIGGALAGNAGAAHRAICEDVVRVWVLTQDDCEKELTSSDFSYTYRRSELAEFIILEAELRLEVAAPDQIDRRLEEMKEMRKGQPVGFASSGCIFKNPPGHKAGQLIDQCGLKGLSVGGVMVSKDHANFLVNKGEGTPAEMMELIDLVREKVFAATSVQLETEVRIVV